VEEEAATDLASRHCEIVWRRFEEDLGQKLKHQKRNLVSVHVSITDASTESNRLSMMAC